MQHATGISQNLVRASRTNGIEGVSILDKRTPEDVLERFFSFQAKAAAIVTDAVCSVPEVEEVALSAVWI